MPTPIHRLLIIGLRHLNEEPDAARRAEMLESAATVFESLGDARTAEQARVTAAMIRSAEDAQLELSRILTEGQSEN